MIVISYDFLPFSKSTEKVVLYKWKSKIKCISRCLKTRLLVQFCCFVDHSYQTHGLFGSMIFLGLFEPFLFMSKKQRAFIYPHTDLPISSALFALLSVPAQNQVIHDENVNVLIVKF